MAMAALPTTLITGFLGSGKTTLLNGLLAHEGMADTAVIINEFGEIGLDHLLIERAFEDAVLLKSGCICCTVGGDRDHRLGRPRTHPPHHHGRAHASAALPRRPGGDHGRCRQRAISARYPL